MRKKITRKMYIIISYRKITVQDLDHHPLNRRIDLGRIKNKKRSIQNILIAAGAGKLLKHLDQNLIKNINIEMIEIITDLEDIIEEMIEIIETENTKIVIEIKDMTKEGIEGIEE